MQIKGASGLRDSLWDFRRGDADDNRTSPYGAGWRRLIFSSALEFSYLKALCAFLILIIIPALIVGAAPSFLVTYSRLTLQQAASTGRNPTIVALVGLIVSLTIAVLVVRRFFSTAVDNYSHLHYTLVFPIFVTLREVLRSISEKFPGMSDTQEHLYQRRRIGTILAAIMLGGAGLALALSVELSFGLQIVDVEQVRPLAVAKAALGNAAVVFGFSTAVASVFWLWRELTVSGPVLDWAPDATSPLSPTVRIAHLSDLHIVGEQYGYRMETGTHGPQGNSCVLSALHQLVAIDTSTPVDRILITGDITDAGTRAEWAAFMDMIKDLPELRSRISFVPGNHDTNIVDRNNTGRPDLPLSIGQALRKLRFVLALDEIQGDRAHLVSKTGSLGPSLADYLREGGRPKLLQSLAENGSLRGRWELSRVWDAIFPLVELPASDKNYGIILLDSNARSNFSLTNAIGVIKPVQLRKLKSILRSSPNRSWLILLHHQVVEYPVSGIRLSDRIGLALMNAADLMAVIAPHAPRTLILHGHRHIGWIGRAGDIVLCSAPSVTLGPDKYRGTFPIYECTVPANGNIHVSANTTMRVSDSYTSLAGDPTKKAA